MNNVLVVTVVLPDSFIESFDNIIDDEIAVSQRKWKISVSNQQRDIIREQSLKQLQSKVSVLSKNTWDLGKKIVINVSKDSGSLTLTGKENIKEKKDFVLNKNGWSVTSEESDSVIHLKDFYETLKNNISEWLRTAVFYGVGSYK